MMMINTFTPLLLLFYHHHYFFYLTYTYNNHTPLLLLFYHHSVKILTATTEKIFTLQRFFLKPIATHHNFSHLPSTHIIKNEKNK